VTEYIFIAPHRRVAGSRVTEPRYSGQDANVWLVELRGGWPIKLLKSCDTPAEAEAYAAEQAIARDLLIRRPK
jgi:hypothetical protein